jgi:hypothetical protein
MLEQSAMIDDTPPPATRASAIEMSLTRRRGRRTPRASITRRSVSKFVLLADTTRISGVAATFADPSSVRWD